MAFVDDLCKTGLGQGFGISARPGAPGLVLITFDIIYQKDFGEIIGRINGLGQGFWIYGRMISDFKY